MTKVYIKSFEPLSIDRSYQQYWSDVWLTFTIKPGRLKKHFSPTLVSLPCVKRDVQLDEEVQKENPGLDYSHDISLNKKIIEQLQSKKYVVHYDKKGSIPDIYTASDYIDQAHVEEMLRFFFSEIGISQVSFKWKRTKISNVINPVMV